MAWEKGPLPANTWNWGGVVPVGESGGFYFADFCGDHVELVGHDVAQRRTLKPEEVALYDNSLELPGATQSLEPGVSPKVGGRRL